MIPIPAWPISIREGRMMAAATTFASVTPAWLRYRPYRIRQSTSYFRARVLWRRSEAHLIGCMLIT